MEVQVGGDDQESDQDEVQNSEDPQRDIIIKGKRPMLFYNI